MIRLFNTKKPEALKRPPVEEGRSVCEMFHYVVYVLVALWPETLV